jgi:exopolyphosphatase/guanosine-5'-triphosphate,3'-diphosphate pyrophosphatase
MLCACIDIGSNTTRMLVAEVSEGRLGSRHEARAFTRIGADMARGGRVSPGKVDEVVATVRDYHRAASAHGVDLIRVVATAAVRQAANRAEVVEALRRGAEVQVDLLSGAEEARLAFLGATRTLDRPVGGVVGVVDVGGGSSEIAVGTVADGVSWSRSVGAGSGSLTDYHCHTDPASPEALRAMAEHATSLLARVPVPPVDVALAVGGSAASLRRMVGPRLAADGVGPAVARLCSAPARELAQPLGLVEERVRLLPAGILFLAAVAGRLGCPLELGSGGIREGVCLELAAARTGPV